MGICGHRQHFLFPGCDRPQFIGPAPTNFATANQCIKTPASSLRHASREVWGR